MKASDWLLQRESAALRRGATMGGAIACVVTVIVMALIHAGLSSWAQAEHEQTVAMIRAEERRELDECRVIVRDLADEEYETVVAYRRQIDELQGRK